MYNIEKSASIINSTVVRTPSNNIIWMVNQIQIFTLREAYSQILLGLPSRNTVVKETKLN